MASRLGRFPPWSTVLSMDLLQRARAERESGVVHTLRDWLAEHPPPASAFTQTAAGVARRVRAGESFDHGVRELLDEVGLMPSAALVESALAERPLPTGDPRRDAYLGAVAEHLAAARGVSRPAWVLDPDRFLDRFWFPSGVPGFRALAVAESPASFRRRGIFISGGSLERC